MLKQAIQNQEFDTLTHQIQVATDTMNNILAGDHSFDALLSLFSQLSSIDFTAVLLKNGIPLKLKGSYITEPAHQAIPNSVCGTLTHQIQVATDTMNNILAGKHRFYALPALSSQLGAIKATATALRLAVLPSEISETQADGNIAAKNNQNPQYIEEMQLNLLWALYGQVAATGNALIGLLEEWPTKKTLEDSISSIYKRIWEINGLAGIMMVANDERLAGSLCESSRAKLENLCREAIENTGKTGGAI